MDRIIVIEDIADIQLDSPPPGKGAVVTMPEAVAKQHMGAQEFIIIEFVSVPIQTDNGLVMPRKTTTEGKAIQ